MKRILNVIFRSRLTFTGAVLAASAFLLFVFLSLIDLVSREPHPYVGLITFTVLPALLNFGLLLIIIGSIRAVRRARRGQPEHPVLPPIDLNSPQHLRALLALSGGLFLFLVLMTFASFQAYESTDSVAFCGLTCHKVMKPEYTTYQVSPHARVACVACHIGPGATPFVRSKLSGTYQVYSVMFNKYHRPIQTPISNLRPARETCQECHWPQNFYAAKLRGKSYYASDEKNSPTKISLLMKIGGGDPKHGNTQGIHFHMYIDRQISYIATDRQRLVIPYVEIRSRDGKVRIYRSKEKSLTAAQERTMPKRLVDCIECHNRPSHRFPHPAESVNQSMELGHIDPSLPEIKKLAVEVLEKPYKTEAEAEAGIPKAITAFYQANHPQVLSTKKALIDAASAEVQKIYSLSFFPEMRSDWKAHPDNASHMYTPGCFRCHDGKHVSDDGKVLTRDCNTCHTLVAETTGGVRSESLAGVPFRHPVDIGEAWKEMMCSDCHVPKEDAGEAK